MLLETFSQLDTDSYDLNVSKGRFLITAQVMSTEILPKEILKRDIPMLLGKEARIEHLVPEIQASSIVGTVTKVWWDDVIDQPFVEVEIFDDSKEMSALRAILLEDQKLPLEQRTIRGLSIGIIKYSTKKGKLKRIFPREVSFTSDPVCEECVIESVQVYNKMGENNINAIQSAYSGQLKAKDDIIKLKDDQISTLNDKLKSEKAEFSASEKLLLDEIKLKTGAIQEKEDALTQALEENSKIKAENAETKKGLERAQKAPLVKSLLTALSLEVNSDAYNKRSESLFKMSPEDLQEKIDDFKALLGLYGKQGNVQFGTEDEDNSESGEGAQSNEMFSRVTRKTKEGKVLDGVQLNKNKVGDVM